MNWKTEVKYQLGHQGIYGKNRVEIRRSETFLLKTWKLMDQKMPEDLRKK